MPEQVNPLQFRWAKRTVVFAEVTSGAFVLALTTALMYRAFTGGTVVPVSEVNSLSRALAVMLLVGMVLFFDGIRRGQRWL